MWKASRSSVLADEKISDIANRIHRRMRKLGLSQTKLAEQCSMDCAHLSEDDERPSLARDRISKLLMNRRARHSKHAARALSQAEFRILARVLKCSVEWLRGDGRSGDPVIWDVLAHPQRDSDLLHLLEEYEERAGEVMVWSEYPLCSFTTEEFMTAFHRAHVGEVDAQNKRALVEFFDRTGRARRRRVLKPNRPFAITSLIYDSELRRVAAGEGVYRSIPKPARKATLEHIVAVLSDPALKMELVIVDEAKVHRPKIAWRDHETVGVMGKLFSIWNYHSTSIGWTENPSYVRHQHDLMNEMKSYAVWKDTEETVQIVLSYIESLV